MEKEYILSLDFGTQSLRAILFDRYGQTIDAEKITYEPYSSANPGWAEKNADDYWNTMCSAISGLKERNPANLNKILGIVVTTLRDSFVNVDINGKPLRPAILWLDQRKASGAPDFSLKDKILLKIIGMQQALEILFRKAKSNWIRQNQPEIWDKTHKYLMISGYINFRLIGEFKDSIANQVGHIPLDYKNKKWITNTSNMKWKIFNINIDRLPELIPPSHILGKITGKAAGETGLPEGTIVYSGGSDKGCETLGVGCSSNDTANISFGTTATIQTTTSKYYETITFIPPFPAVIPGMYNPEIQIERGYWLISWFKNEFSKKECMEAEQLNITPEELLNRKLEEVPPGCHGLILQPSWSPGILTPTAKGSIIGFGDVHDHAHLYRAIIEGINYSLITGIIKIEKKSGIKIKTLTVAGGGSQSDVILQITADMFNRPVRRPENFEASALGAAIIGFIGAGIYKNYDEAISNMVRYSKYFYPRKKNIRIYRETYKRIYVRINSRLKKLYHEIQSITNYPEI
ncbi:MAG: FGGY-family carbohydrate kinase [Spirochaetes bacterium]|nr:FGGY-family carbohydrate kinase [Spirochaetota bacterium]